MREGGKSRIARPFPPSGGSSLERYYDFGMSNEVHKKELISTVNETISQIDRLPLHPMNKLRLYN